MIELAAPSLILSERPALVRASDLAGIPSFEEMQARQKAAFPFPAFCPKGQTWTTTFSQALDNNQTGLTDYSFRTVIPAASISTSGSTIRITFEAHSTLQLNIDNASIVERSGSTENGTTTPTSLLFSGAANTSITGGTQKTSDALSYSLDETKDYLVVVDVSSTNGNTRRYGSSGTTYYKAATNSYNVQSPAGFSSAAVLWNVPKIEVLV